MQFLKILIIQFTFLLGGRLMPLLAQGTPEFKVKAVFLYNFTQFVDWPPGTFATSQSPLIIGILGTDPFGPYLQETVAGEKINGHPLIIIHYKAIEEVSGCHILFINTGNKRDKVMGGLRGRSILTVSDATDFTKLGGMIRFFTKDNKMKLEINLEAAKASNLAISSKLLRLAEIYKP